jgi:DNA polymerase-3 subunit gamma/tau
VNQLKKICENDGVTCEEEALHLIASKADGAMRDALSIYDRITSFTGKSVRAADVIENLNILDYEYYFTITEAFLTEDVAACFNLFEDVINHGFDGDTFINGLAEHFRNLMVCKDESTLNLLDTSDAILEKYRNQAAIVPASFLLSGLNILNTADVTYRASKNKRLHAELALMKLVYMHQAVSTSTLAEKKTPDRKETVKEPPQEKIQSIENKSVVESVTKKAKVITVVPEGETVMIPKKSELRSSVQKETAVEDTEIKTLQREEITPVSPELFFIVWKQYADHIRKDHQRIAITMDHAEISLLENNLIEVKLDSAIEHNLMKDMITEIRAFIAEEMQNNNFELALVVDANKAERTKRPYTAQEKYKKMEEKNPLIREIKNTLGLELDY